MTQFIKLFRKETTYHHGADVVAVLVPLDGRPRDVIVGVDDADVDVGGGGNFLALIEKLI